MLGEYQELENEEISFCETNYSNYTGLCDCMFISLYECVLVRGKDCSRDYYGKYIVSLCLKSTFYALFFFSFQLQ